MSDFTSKDIVIEALDLLVGDDDITLEEIEKAKFWAEECDRITKIHYPERFTR